MTAFKSSTATTAEKTTVKSADSQRRREGSAGRLVFLPWEWRIKCSLNMHVRFEAAILVDQPKAAVGSFDHQVADIGAVDAAGGRHRKDRLAVAAVQGEGN